MTATKRIKTDDAILCSRLSTFSIVEWFFELDRFLSHSPFAPAPHIRNRKEAILLRGFVEAIGKGDVALEEEDVHFLEQIEGECKPKWFGDGFPDSFL